MSSEKRFAVPTIFTIFGITGDLVERKVLAALFRLFLAGRLPAKCIFYGVARRPWQDSDLREYLSQILEKKQLGTKESRAEFVSLFQYVSGTFESAATFKKLSDLLGRSDREWRFCSNKLFYLAASPAHYVPILKNLDRSGLTAPCSPTEGWTRVILEKPFGTNQKSARAIEVLLASLFKEEQIYRLDHYLGRETVRNIIAFRFSNSFLQPAWNAENIERIDVRLLEKGSVGGRGEFYDATGAFLDVGQNHLLQLLALFIMDNPGSFTTEAIRRERHRALLCLPHFDRESVYAASARAQYAGYTSEKGVAPGSRTETYFKLKVEIAEGAFRGVPVYFESGKGLSENRSEIQVTFRHPDPCLCKPPNYEGEAPVVHHQNNVLHFHLKPDESIKMRFFVKSPGHTYALTREDFGFDYTQVKNVSDQLSDYEVLILNIVEGDQTLFTSSAEVTAEWKFAEPIVSAWQKQKKTLPTYALGDKFSMPIPLDEMPEMAHEIGVVGLGKMGANFAEHLLDKGWAVHGYNRSPEKTLQLAESGLRPALSIKELVSKLPTPRLVWLMVPAGEAVDQTLFGKDGLATHLSPGDIVVDGGNSFYKDSIARGKKLARKKIRYIDVGFSGGPYGARRGACFMVGGDKKLYKEILPLLLAAALPGGVEHFEGLGAGHFVKMIHNGIEYGMMQAIAEGFTILQKSPFKPDLAAVARVYNRGSVIGSRLVGWLRQALVHYGNDLKDISGAVSQTGEGRWTVDTASELGVSDKVIHEALLFRDRSGKNPSFTGKIVSAIRNQFGGHDVQVTRKRKK